MRKILWFLVLCGPIWAMTDIAVPNVFVDSGVIIASEFNENNDSLESRINKNKDTLELKFIRFKDLEGGDSTLDRIQADTIRGNPNVDSIFGLNVMRGNPDLDSISGLNVLRGNPNIDSISGSPKINAVTVIGTATVDSLVSTKMVNGNLKGNVTGNVTGNITGNVTGTADSAKGAHHLAGGSVSATTGLFSSTVNVDSLHTTKGASILYADIQRGEIDSLTVTTNMSADSVFSTKGIKSTTVNTGQGNYEVYSMNQNVSTTSDVTYDTVQSTGKLRFTSANVGAIEFANGGYANIRIAHDDAGDVDNLNICGGGDISTDRGAYMRLFGADAASNNGDMFLYGDTINVMGKANFPSGSSLEVGTGGSTITKIELIDATVDSLAITVGGKRTVFAATVSP